MQRTQLRAFPSYRHAHASDEAVAEDDCAVDEPFRTRKISLAKLWIVFASAVRQRDSLTLRVDRVDVVLLVLSPQFARGA